VPLVEALAEGPLDIIGDVHGEIEALNALLAHLGYAPDGAHPEQRTLVFVGDLVDRGPDSPAVLARVMQLVAAGRAQCIAGNHELNLLRDDAKHGNSWWTAPEQPTTHPMAGITPAAKPAAQAFLASLPLALERDDLRVVHACWHHASVTTIREAVAHGGAAALYDHYVQRTTATMLENRFLAFVRREWRQHAPKLDDPDWQPTFMPALAELNTRTQMDNPVAVLTSGIEAPADAPFWAGGKWRMVQRVKWWDDYAAGPPVIVGHYWRRYIAGEIALNDKYGPDLLAGIEPHQWMGAARNVYCVDFSVGARAEQRASGADEQACKLAALRAPEWEIVHDDGRCFQLDAPGSG
jgi:hypothetical protein